VTSTEEAATKKKFVPAANQYKTETYDNFMYRIPGTASLKSPRIYPYMEAQANASKVPYAKDIMHSFDFT
jgi:hypothetical protein